ncbi:hypothetical protein [Rubrivivax albus]|uniref:Uncharacterized protein n=1 Tax=Rubrivivax albus TaxID=2499835 RepID=A0A437JTS0_9BURK|nr:hypothetical protein [Rubrivivax albus]RVT50468.1 hypothetical protein ENE75_15805 [Rubrivivax albus]
MSADASGVRVESPRRSSGAGIGLLPLAIALGVTACATNAPYVEVSGYKTARADGHEEEIIIRGVDGKLDFDGLREVTIEPGAHVLLLDTARNRRAVDPAVLVPLNAKACLRYSFVARHETMTGLRPWQVVLKDVQPIPECVARFPDHAPVPSAAASAPR